MTRLNPPIIPDHQMEERFSNMPVRLALTAAEAFGTGTWHPVESAGRVYWMACKVEEGPDGRAKVSFDQVELEHGMSTVRYETEALAAARCRALNHLEEK